MSTYSLNVLPAPLPAKVNLAGMALAQLREFFVGIGEKPFRALQVLKWIHQRGVLDFAAMTDLSQELRHKLPSLASIVFPEIVEQHVSKDGTHKWLLAVTNGQLVETVFIPEKNRGTLCISSQVGCAINCAFCATAKQGFNGNLTASEIIGQVWQARQRLQTISHPAIPVTRITNVVMMGMGEPLLNFAAVVAATALMRDDNAYGLARRRVTVSTSGIVPGIAKLAEEADVALAVSLHAPTNNIRDILVPINKKYPLETLILACKDYLKISKLDSITIEYVMLIGLNDQPEHAKQLIKVLAGLCCKVNLIPFNSHSNSQFTCSTTEAIYAFNQKLNKAGIVTTVRTTRGDDIAAACGQLVGKLQSGTKNLEVNKE